MKRFQFLLFPLLYAAIFISFLYPEFNPDLFWHLAAARAAEAEGKLFLSREIFSFTLNGAPWLNFEWLFQWLMWELFGLGGFRLLVLWRAAMITGTIALLDFYMSRLFTRRGNATAEGLVCAQLQRAQTGWPEQPPIAPSILLRLANIVFAFLFLSTRASTQPELFTLLFLVLFFILRDAFWEDRRGVFLGLAWAALFAFWANVHGGYVLGIGILGLQFIARGLHWANKSQDAALLRREMKILFWLGLSAFFATWINPWGPKVYAVIFEHLRDSAAISRMIDEWQPSQFYTRESWPYLALLFVLAVNLAGFLKRGAVPFEAILIVLAFARFASSHVRHVAVFGAACLPIFWSTFYSGAVQPWLIRFNRAAVGAGLIFGLIFIPVTAFRESMKIAGAGIPRTHVRGDNYPHRALYFMEANPFLIRLNALVEWGWGGYAEFRLHEKGLRTFFDGRYLFHHLLEESMEASADPKGWEAYADRNGIDLCLLKYPKDPSDFRLVKEGNQEIPRSWHSQAISREKWALVWWDHVALLFVRRDKVSPEWLKRHEYKTPLPYDPYWVERQVKEGRVRIKDLVNEVYRNIAETQVNKINTGLLMAIGTWEAEMEKSQK